MAKVFHSVLTAIDVGTTKISVLIAQKVSDDSVKILGVGKSLSDGLDRGVVVDVARTVQSIKKAIQEAELMAGCSITPALIGISGSHIDSFNTHGAMPIPQKSNICCCSRNYIISYFSSKAIPIIMLCCFYFLYPIINPPWPY